jgi:hypothetical protein
MRLTLATSAAAVALVALGFAAVAEVARHPAPAVARVAMDVDVRPVQGRAGRFLLTSTVTDLESGEVLAKPSMAIASGQPAHLRIGGQGGWTLELGVAANGASRQATYDATFSRNGNVLSRQHLALDLGH